MLKGLMARKDVVTRYKLGVFLMGAFLTMIASSAWSNVGLDEALQLAQGEADAWDPANELVGIMGAWIQEDGILHEPEDSPGWGFLYINGAGDKRVNIAVYADGQVDPSDEYDHYEGMLSTAMSEYTSEHVIGWIENALQELATMPDPPGTGSGDLDMVIFAGYDESSQSEDVVICFYEEADQDTEWTGLGMSWLELLRSADAAVHLDAATGEVEARSWETDLDGMDSILISRSPWILKEYIVYPGGDLNSDGVLNTNMLHEIDEEGLDDIYVFNADGTYYQHQGDDLHSFYTNETYIRGTWALKDGDLVIELTVTEHDGEILDPPFVEDVNIIELDEDILRLFYERGEEIPDFQSVHIYQELVPQELAPDGISHSVSRDESPPFSPDLLVSESPWMLNKYTVYPGHDLDGDGMASTDMMDEIDSEGCDDIFVFNADGTYYQHQGEALHSFYENETYIRGTWTLKKNDIVIELTVTEHDGTALDPPVIEDLHLLELAPHILKLFYKRGEDILDVPALHIYQEFVSKPEPKPVGEDFSNVFFMPLAEGLNMVSLPLKPAAPCSVRSFAETIGATAVIEFDEARQKFVGFTLDAPGPGFAIKGGKGYIVNVPAGGVITFTGAAWANRPPVGASPPLMSDAFDGAWAFVLSGKFAETAKDGYRVTVWNTRTGATVTDVVRSGHFAATFADLSRKSVVETGDTLEVTVRNQAGEIVSDTLPYTVTADAIRQAFLPITLRGVESPRKALLLQNYPNPFNPETWIPYQLQESAEVVIRIYDSTGRLVRTLDLGRRAAGFHICKARAAYWNGVNNAGERVASDIYFYRIEANDFSATRKMIMAK